MSRVPDNSTKMVNLKDAAYLIPQYVRLRNKNTEYLLTDRVNTDSTKKWLNNENAEVLCLLERKSLLGVVILFLRRKGEIAIFVKEKYKGIGTFLLNAAELAARRKKLKFIWAWVLDTNKPAQGLFKKCGFRFSVKSQKKYHNNEYKGRLFQKKLSTGAEAFKVPNE